MIGACVRFIIGLRRLRWDSDAEWCSDGVQEVLRFGGAKSWQEFVGERLLTYRYDRYARLRGSALRSVERLPSTAAQVGGGRD